MNVRRSAGFGVQRSFRLLLPTPSPDQQVRPARPNITTNGAIDQEREGTQQCQAIALYRQTVYRDSRTQNSGKMKETTASVFTSMMELKLRRSGWTVSTRFLVFNAEMSTILSAQRICQCVWCCGLNSPRCKVKKLTKGSVWGHQQSNDQTTGCNIYCSWWF